MWVRRGCYYFKPFVPMVIGLCLGIGLSLILTPFLDDNCGVYTRTSESDSEHLPKGRSLESLQESPSFDYKSEDFEPRIKRQLKPKLPGSKNTGRRKFIRPRYASTELGIREKLFVAVLTSKATIDTFGVAMNKTLSRHISKLVFFMDTRGPDLPVGMSIVSFTDNRKDLKPFHMIKYIGDHYKAAYDWFFIVPDDTYVRAEKVLDFVSDISISKKLHLGIPSVSKDASFCSIGAGIVLSQEVLASIYDNNKWCSQNAFSPDIEDNIGRCIYQSTGLACTDTINGKVFNHYKVSKGVDLDKLPPVNQFKSALTVGRLDSPIDMYKIHRYFCHLEFNNTQKELDKIKSSIVNMSTLTPEGRTSATWPVGVEEQYKPKTRFDVIKWDYFTETHIYLNDDFTTVDTLKGVDKLDIDDIIQTSMKRLNKKYKGLYFYEQLVNGYRRFDPTRGMEYTLDLGLLNKKTQQVVTKRVHLVRPLSQVEIVTMPYVTENSRVNLVLPVTSADRDGVVSFLDSYAHTCLESGDNTNLLILFIYETQLVNKDDIFTVLKSMITYYENKYQNGARMTWVSVREEDSSPLVMMNTVSERFKAEDLILLCTVGMDLNIDLLNRVRMNTIQKWQVYFPIGFYQYKPNLIYAEKPYPTMVEIKKNVGHYDSNSYAHASFYNSDYMEARSDTKNLKIENDLFDMFISQQKLHIFRAVEPSLKHRYRDKSCDPVLKEDAYKRCLVSRAHGLASQSQLAMLIFEQQKNVDTMHLQVLHQQKDPAIDQMKVRK